MLTQKYLEEELRKHFRYDSFRTGQREIISDILQGKNVLGILPTGSGKSLCYQLPALLLDGLTIVVSPLISLMMDQVNELKAISYKRVATINSFIGIEEKEFILQHLHRYKLLYISPELLQQEKMLECLKRMKVSLFVVDEAHCISQWGHDFRPDYLKLGKIIEQLNHPPVLALSATAPPAVQEDIVRNLHLPQMVKHIHPMDRANLTFVVEHVASESEKYEQILTYLQKISGPTLIYFSSRNQTEETAKILAEKLPDVNIAFYHGGMEPMDRIHIQQQFMNGQIDVVCCTSAFGMGINKEDVRLVIHFHMPAEMEAYIQEVGRAGRDGNPSMCLLLYGPNDWHVPKTLIENELPQAEEIRIVMEQLKGLATQSAELPSKEWTGTIHEFFQINETKWRFLRFHFEKHGMMKGKKIDYDEKQWQAVYQHLVEWIRKRNIHKMQKLGEMVEWVNTVQCLREALYNKFQSGYSQPIFQCCSNCGIELDEWFSEEKPKRVKTELDWRLKLRKLLVE